MPALIITGSGARAGKTALAAGLLSRLTALGKQAALVRPAAARPGTQPGVTLVDGLDLTGGPYAARQLAETLDAGVIHVERYDNAQDPRALARALAPLQGRLAGLVLNQVPAYRHTHASRTVVPALQQTGLRVLGTIGEDRRMAAPTLHQIAEKLNAQFLLLPEKADNLVEHVMIGGWFLDEGRYVFSQRARKAVLVRGDRPDLQMAALETDTVGLVLTGGKQPVQYTVYHAETQEVPLVLTSLGTVEAMEQLQGIHSAVTVDHPEKSARFAELLDRAGAMDALLAAVGVVPAPAGA
ncbi:MAG: hypothetical protein FJ315_01295 [SAR202 cluster bacterium]|nr:hypothetical protein [SAR202 cluster bacterium]